MTSLHTGISKTAKSLFYMRMLANIPYARDIGELLGAREAVVELVGGEQSFPQFAQHFGPFTEHRYRALSRAAYEYTTVVELAAGFSPRGLITTQRSGVTYVETDLEPVITQKRDVADKVLQGEPRPNLAFESVDATSRSDVMRMGRYLEVEGPRAVINEGLLDYLTHEEKRAVGQNIRALLEPAGGAWVTPDILTRVQNERFTELCGGSINSLMANVGRSFSDTCFEDFDEAQAFFEDIGFKVLRRFQRDYIRTDQLTLEPSEELEELLSHQPLWLLYPK